MANFLRRWRAPVLGGVAVFVLSFPLLTSHPVSITLVTAHGVKAADVEAGDHYAILASLVATCEAREVDPVAYLKDVLMRVDVHPASRIDELLPHNWTPPLRWTDTS